MNGPDDLTRQSLLAAAALLEQGSRLDALSRGLTIAAFAGLIALPGHVPGTVLLVLCGIAAAGLIALYFAVRVGLDAALFRQMADADVTAFDAAMVAIGLLPEARTGRPVEARIGGARRLFHRQAAALASQLGLTAAAIWAGIVP